MNEERDPIIGELRDVLAHQAASIDVAAGTAPDVNVAPLLEDDGTNVRALEPRRRARTIATSAVGGIVAIAAAIALFVAVVSPSGQTQQDRDSVRVLGALNSTTNTGSFETSYAIVVGGTRTPAACDPTTAAGACKQGVPINGTATVNVNPLAGSTESNVPGIGRVTLQFNDHHVWERTAGSPAPALDASLYDFVTDAEGSLGIREAGTVMLSISNPAGYLGITRDAAKHVAPRGTNVVDGVKVDLYEVTLTPDQMRNVPGVSADEARTIGFVLDHMIADGYTGTTMTIGVGADDKVHSLTSVANYRDGGSVTLSATFSKFGCAGRVVLPDAPKQPPAASAPRCQPEQTTTTTTSSTTVATSITVPVGVRTPPGTGVPPPGEKG